MVASTQPRRTRKSCSICVLPLPSFPLNVQMRMAFTLTGSGHPGCILGTFQHPNLQTFKRSRTNSFSHNLLSDPHPLNPVLSIFYKKGGGEGAPIRRFQRSHMQASGRSDVHVPRPLESTLTQPPTSVDSKPLMTNTKSFISNTYKKHRGVGSLWLTRNRIRIPVLRSIATKDLSRLTLPSNQALAGEGGGLTGVPEPSFRV
jgi:hypothetical protein